MLISILPLLMAAWKRTKSIEVAKPGVGEAISKLGALILGKLSPAGARHTSRRKNDMMIRKVTLLLVKLQDYILVSYKGLPTTEEWYSQRKWT